MKVLLHADFVKLLVTLWAVWWARRQAIHEGIFQSPQATHASVGRFIMELEIVRDIKPIGNTKAAASSPVVTNVRPKARPMGFPKIHVDTGVRGKI